MLDREIKQQLKQYMELMENEVVIRCREQDVDQVNGAIERATDKYEETMKVRPSFTVSDEYLPSSG